MRLDSYTARGFDRGASLWRQVIWYAANRLLLQSWLPGSRWRKILLVIFGAEVGKGVVIKPGVRVKFPWRLKVGDYTWVGEDVWVDNLAEVVIGSHVCISQGAYLCTGSHNWSAEAFDLITKGIIIEDHAWVGARASLAPGASMAVGAVLSMSSLGCGEISSWTIYAGTPAVAQRARHH